MKNEFFDLIIKKINSDLTKAKGISCNVCVYTDNNHDDYVCCWFNLKPSEFKEKNILKVLDVVNKYKKIKKRDVAMLHVDIEFPETNIFITDWERYNIKKV